LVAFGGVMTLLLFGGSEKKSQRKRGRHLRTGQKSNAGRPPGTTELVIYMSLFALIALTLAGFAVYSFRLPAEKTEFIERLRYEHAAAFTYVVHTQPSELYPKGKVGPISPPSPGVIATVEIPPVFTRLARSLDLDFTYLFKSTLPSDMQGELSAVLQIKAGEGWTKTEELLPPTPFNGSRTSSRVSVNFSQILSLTETIEKQTGFNPGTYEVSIIPTVRISGHIGAEAINDTYAPAFTMKLNPSQIVLDPAVGRTEVKTLGDRVSRAQELHLLNRSIPVMTARWWSVAGTAFSALVAIFLAVVVFLGLGRGEAAQIQARYKAMIISVAQADLEAAQRIQVASMQDLARLAQRDGQIIFHQQTRPDLHLYFVHEGQVVYTYSVPESIKEN
ncbi:MAG: hypothetical protein IT330_11680, partial [Anaerolineae bacterium]|nr:hypothetical protein [Anaerolineae bacterium]